MPKALAAPLSALCPKVGASVGVADVSALGAEVDGAGEIAAVGVMVGAAYGNGTPSPICKTLKPEPAPALLLLLYRAKASVMEYDVEGPVSHPVPPPPL